MFDSTEGNANDILLPRMRVTSEQLFTHTEEVWEVLDEAFIDPEAKRTAENLYEDLHMFENESFVSFKNRFLEYAAAAEIPAARRLKDIWYKCTPDLRIATSDFPLNHLSFAILSQ